MLKLSIIALTILAAAAPDGCEPTMEYPGTPVTGGPSLPAGCVSPTYWGNTQSMIGYGTSFNVSPPCPASKTEQIDLAPYTWRLTNEETCTYTGSISGHDIITWSTEQRLVNLAPIATGWHWCTPFQLNRTYMLTETDPDQECRYRFAACAPYQP